MTVELRVALRAEVAADRAPQLITFYRFAEFTHVIAAEPSHLRAPISTPPISALYISALYIITRYSNNSSE